MAAVFRSLQEIIFFTLVLLVLVARGSSRELLQDKTVEEVEELMQCSPPKGQRSSASERIINGQDAVQSGQAQPWLVQIFAFWEEDGVVKLAPYDTCTGVLISRRHVITTGGCVAFFTDGETYKVAVTHENLFDLDDYWVSDYSYEWDEEAEEWKEKEKESTESFEFPDYVHDVADVCIHPKETLGYDLAILTLADPVPEDSGFVPVCLPSGQKMYYGEDLTIAGLGFTKVYDPSKSNSFPTNVQAAKVKDGTLACDEDPTGKFKVDTFDKTLELCSKQTTDDGYGHQANFDDGGPLTTSAYEDGGVRLVGIMTYQSILTTPYSRYVRVSAHLDWIRSVFKGDGQCAEME